jgi:hypothetical protein
MAEREQKFSPCLGLLNNADFGFGICHDKYKLKHGNMKDDFFWKKGRSTALSYKNGKHANNYIIEG